MPRHAHWVARRTSGSGMGLKKHGTGPWKHASRPPALIRRNQCRRCGLSISIAVRAEESHQSCHPADAVSLSVRTHVPLYATARALKMGCWKSIQPWLETISHHGTFPRGNKVVLSSGSCR
jgi:hypothetical protein